MSGEDEDVTTTDTTDGLTVAEALAAGQAPPPNPIPDGGWTIPSAEELQALEDQVR